MFLHDQREQERREYKRKKCQKTPQLFKRKTTNFREPLGTADVFQVTTRTRGFVIADYKMS